MKYEPEKDIDQTPTGMFVRKYSKYGVTYEHVIMCVGKTEPETEHNLDLWEQVLINKSKMKENNTKQAQSHKYRKHRTNVNYGYLFDSLGNIALNNDEQDVIAIIMFLHKKGLSYNQISNELFKREIKTRKGNERWGASVIRAIVIREQVV